VLGRGVVVGDGDPVPPPWRDAEVVQVDAAALSAPGAAVGALHGAWAERRPLVVSLAVDPAAFRQPETADVEPWTLDAAFELWLDRLHFLVWANTYDARGGIEPVWWWGRKAARLGATAVIGPGAGDVTLPDGTPAWVDGGPRGPLDPGALGAAVVHREAVEAGRLSVEPPPGPVTADLAPDQLAAVAHGAGPARIIAPAGSGKTRVLTERLRHLHVHRGLERDGVLAVAYNKKAQLEMEARTTDFRPRVSTLNALGYRLLADHGGRPLRVLEEREVRTLVDELAPARTRRANVDPIAPYLEGLSAIRLGLRDPEEVESERDDVPGLSRLFGPYRRALAASGTVDFDEQVYGALAVLLADGEFRRRIQAGYRHVLVDELQDLTPAHVLLLRLLASPALDVFGVGDDDQVIYGHAGADPAFLIDFERLFPGAASHPLEVNYRCPVAVVDAARMLLGYNHRRVGKVIRPGPDAATDASALVVRRHRPEAGSRELVGVVQGWLATDGVTPAEVAVLTRVNSLLLAPQVALLEAGVPVSSLLSPEVLERTGVRAALAYLRLGADPDRMAPEDLQEVQRRPSRGFPQWIGKWLQRPMSIAQLRAVAERIDDVKVADKMEGFADDLATVARAVADGTTRTALTVIANDVGLGRAMSLLDVSKGGQTASQLDDLDALVQVADLHDDPRTFEAWLRAVLRRSTEDGGVTLSTVHRVKGMEWDRVVVAGVSGGVLPHRLATDVEEERRVLHVAITRARHRVVVLADETRPSAFLDELDGTAPLRPASDAVTSAARPSAPRQVRKTSTLEARVGLVVEANGGFVGEIVELTDDGAQLALQTGAKLFVRYGETVSIRGRAATLVPVPDLPPEVAAAEEALRAWRLERCRADKVSAFIVASNAVLRAVATHRPTTLAELAAIDGIGPTKLDLYGDEMLAVLQSLSEG
jgi:DNA helicase-2/ATP-dependent DNA helicase PcrA